MSSISIESLGASISPLLGIEKSPTATVPPTADIAASATPAGAFSSLIQKGLSDVNQQMMSAQVDLQQLASGNVENLHQVMIRLEESRLSFQLMMQVRSRLLEAYQDVMKMPI